MPNRQAQKINGPVTKPKSFNWNDDPSVQKLLEVIVNIMAEEYIEVVRQNPDIFSNNGGAQ